MALDEYAPIPSLKTHWNHGAFWENECERVLKLTRATPYITPSMDTGQNKITQRASLITPKQ